MIQELWISLYSTQPHSSTALKYMRGDLVPGVQEWEASDWNLLNLTPFAHKPKKQICFLFKTFTIKEYLVEPNHM